MNRRLIVAILIISTLPVYAQGQQPNADKLKADAQKVVTIISSDTAKFHSYCQIVDLADEIEGAKQEQDSKKAKELSAKINDLEKKLGPEYFALAAGLKGVDPNSSDAQEINSILEELDESCGDQQQRLVLAAIRQCDETNKSSLLAYLGCQTNPFETGWAMKANWLPKRALIVHAEVYPSVRDAKPDTIKDRGQVRAMWEWARDLDGQNLLWCEFCRPIDIESGFKEDIAIQLTEGWILGASPTVRAQ